MIRQDVVVSGAAPYCTDDFTYSGPFPNPMSLADWVQSANPLQKAIPDWSFNARYEREDDQIVHIAVQVTGSQTGDLDLSAMDMSFVPATSKTITLPETTGRLIFRGDKIANLHVDMVEGTGIPGILSELVAS